MKDDWTLKNWEVVKGPWLWFRGEVPPVPEGHVVRVVQDYYRGHGNPHLDPVLAAHLPAAPDNASGTAEIESQDRKGECNLIDLTCL